MSQDQERSVEEQKKQDEQQEQSASDTAIAYHHPDFYQQATPAVPAPQRQEEPVLAASPATRGETNYGAVPARPVPPAHFAGSPPVAQPPVGSAPWAGAPLPTQPYAPQPSTGWMPRSRRLFWVVFTCLAIGLLAMCGSITWTFTETMRFFESRQDETTHTSQSVRDFYSALQSQQYERAFSYLDTSDDLKGLTKEQFIANMKELDRTQGKVMTFEVTSLLENEPNASFSQYVKAKVKRANDPKEYTTAFKVKLIDEKWKIVGFTQI